MVQCRQFNADSLCGYEASQLEKDYYYFRNSYL